MPTPIDRIIAFIPGYLQSRAQANQGICLLAHEMIDTYKDRGVRVELNEWNSDWYAQAEWLYRITLGTDPAKLKILVVAYSWGGGFGFVTFANQLKDRGIPINNAVLSDPVYHLGGRLCHALCIAQGVAYYPKYPCMLSLIARPKIPVPSNVQCVDQFIQKNSRLRGHELKLDNPETKFNRTEIRFRTHTNMDECPEFYDAVRVRAGELFGPGEKCDE